MMITQYGVFAEQDPVQLKAESSIVKMKIVDKDNFIKTIITLFIMILISLVQSFALRIIIYLAT